MSVYSEPMRRVVRYYLINLFFFFPFFRFSSCKGLLAIPNTFHKYLPGIVGLVDVMKVEDLRVPRKEETSSEMVSRKHPQRPGHRSHTS